MTDLIDLPAVRDAATRIAPWILRTPLVDLGRTGILLKAESLQPSGAFKLRGAFNSLLLMSEDERYRGVVAHSSGNHAVAVAMAASRLGIPATIVMPSNAPVVKRDWTARLGAAIELVGPASTDRTQRAAELARERGLVQVEPYDSPAIIAATGTIMLELLDALADRPDQTIEVYAPVSGGGLIAGVAATAKQSDREVRVIGVEPELAADALASLRAGERVELPADDVSRTIADGLRVQQLGALPWRHIERFVDDIVTVSEAEILDAIRRIAMESRLIAEPSGAVAPAAALASAERGSDGALRVALLSGGNVDPTLLAEVLSSEDGPVG